MRHKVSASVRKNYMTLRTDLAAKEETVLEESGIVLDPVRNRVPEDLKTKPDMKLLLNDLINEAYRYEVVYSRPSTGNISVVIRILATFRKQ